MPLVTCVLTAFDYAPYVELAISSALSQQGLPDDAVEVIAVDDGSTDGTLELLDAMGAPVRVIRQHRLGPAIGTNRGIAEARGRYVALLDADDEWNPGKLASQIALLQARPEVGLVYGDMEVVDAGGRVLQPSNFSWTQQVPAVGRALGTFLGRNLATTSTIIMPTEIARAVPPAPEWAWCRDWWLAAHIAMTHELDCIPEPVTRYRMHGTNLSALEDGQRKKTLRLWHRDLRVRRIFLRALDLSSVTLEELEVAWARFRYFTGEVAGGRGVPVTDVLPVSADDRAEASAALAVARATLEDDPLAAGRAAARALGADPFDAGAARALADARLRASTSGSRRPPLRSVAQADRLRELHARRTAVAGAMTLDDRLGAFHRFETLRRMLEVSGTPATELVRLTVEDRDSAIDAVEAGVRAAAGGRYADAAMALTTAAACDPANEHARLRLDDALNALAGRTPRRSAPEARSALQRRPLPALDGARTFVGLAFADELVSDPALLAAWAGAFGEDDDATLAIYAPGRDEAEVVADLEGALAAAGIAEDDGRDLVAVVAPATPDLETGLARGVHALLTRSPAPGPFAGLSATTGDGLRELAERRWGYGGLGRPISIAIKICPQRWDGAESWGDTHFANALATEFERRGHTALIQVTEEWDDPQGRACDVALHLRGLWPYVPHPGQVNILWNISHPDLVTPGEASRYDAVFTASARFAERLAGQVEVPVGVLEQASDPSAFFPERDARHEREIVFVGNSRGVARPVVAELLPTDRDLAVWGKGWEPFLGARHRAGDFLPNDQVRAAYTSAAIVLNDHWDDMREHGFVSNRVYDVLACGGLLVSDDLPELHERFGDSLLTFSDGAALRGHVERLLANPEERATIAARGRELVLSQHTFAHRVDALLDVLAPLIGGVSPDPLTVTA